MEGTMLLGLQEICIKVQKELRPFPHGCCLYTSSEIERQLKLPQVYGYFVDNDGLGNEHYWNFDPKTQHFIDLTAQQFDGSLPKIFIVPKDSPEAEKRYVALHSSIDFLVLD